MTQLPAKIEKLVRPEPNSGCWLWLGTLKNGYGMYSFTRAHRLVYEHERGPVPEGLVLDHKCRVRSCVNPDHLEPVTNRENILRGVGLTAENVKKTHCPHGHEYTPANVLIQRSKDGTYRKCRTCQNIYQRGRMRRYRAAIRAQSALTAALKEA